MTDNTFAIPNIGPKCEMTLTRSRAAGSNLDDRLDRLGWSNIDRRPGFDAILRRMKPVEQRKDRWEHIDASDEPAGGGRRRALPATDSIIKREASIAREVRCLKEALQVSTEETRARHRCRHREYRAEGLGHLDVLGRNSAIAIALHSLHVLPRTSD